MRRPVSTGPRLLLPRPIPILLPSGDSSSSNILRSRRPSLGFIFPCFDRNYEPALLREPVIETGPKGRGIYSTSLDRNGWLVSPQLGSKLFQVRSVKCEKGSCFPQQETQNLIISWLPANWFHYGTFSAKPLPICHWFIQTRCFYSFLIFFHVCFSLALPPVFVTSQLFFF